MSAETYQRLESDLKTIRQAAGIDFPFNRTQIPIKITYAVSGLVAATWAWFATGVSIPLLVAVFIVLLIAPAITHAAIKAKRSKAEFEKMVHQASKDGYSWLAKLFISELIAAIAGASISIWLVITHGLEFKEMLLIIFTFIGTACFIISFYDRNQRSILSAGVGLFGVALLWLLTSIDLLILVGFFWFVAFMLETIIVRFRLRQLDQWE
jgi:hypothetical protein